MDQGRCRTAADALEPIPCGDCNGRFRHQRVSLAQCISAMRSARARPVTMARWRGQHAFAREPVLQYLIIGHAIGPKGVSRRGDRSSL